MARSRSRVGASLRHAKLKTASTLQDELSGTYQVLRGQVRKVLDYHLQLLEDYLRPFRLVLRKGGPYGPATYALEAEHNTWLFVMRIPADLMSRGSHDAMENFIEHLQLEAYREQEQARKRRGARRGAQPA